MSKPTEKKVVVKRSEKQKAQVQKSHQALLKHLDNIKKREAKGEEFVPKKVDREKKRSTKSCTKKSASRSF